MCVSENQSLPLLWLLSDARNDAGLEAALARLPQRSGFVFRHYHLDREARRARYDALRELARAYGHTTILAGEADWPCDGRYGARAPSGVGLRLATAHDAEELDAAVAAGVDGIFLSPVFPTASHPGAATLGPHGFHVLAQRVPARIPVIALGGMTRARAGELAWPRWAAIDGLA